MSRDILGYFGTDWTWDTEWMREEGMSWDVRRRPYLGTCWTWDLEREGFQGRPKTSWVILRLVGLGTQRGQERDVPGCPETSWVMLRLVGLGTQRE